MSQIKPPPGYNPFPTGQPQAAPPAKRGLSTGAIVGIGCAIVAGIVLVCVVLLVMLYFRYSTDSDVMTQVKSPDGLTEISVPDNWFELNMNEDSSIERANPFSENYVVVISEHEREVAGIVDSLEAYGDLIVGAMASLADSSNLSDPESLQVNGLPALRYRLRARLEGIDVVYTVTILKGKRHYHQVLLWTLANREGQNMPLLLSIADSFQEIR